MSASFTGARRDFDERDAETAAECEWDSCGWPIWPAGFEPSADFRTMAEVRLCGRNAGRAKGSGDMFLCWQHREMWIREAAHLIRSGALSVNDRYSLTTAALARIGSLSPDERATASRELCDLIVEYIENLRCGIKDDRYINPDISRALDLLIESRLLQKWGAA